MNGVKFGDKHSITDWDLIMISKSIGKAEPKTNKIEIPGRDGTIDLTEALGEVKYNDRAISFNFDTLKPPSSWWELDRTITNYIQGKKLAVTLDQDSNYYYLARLKVDSFTNDKNVGHFSISGTAEPYKYKKDMTVKSYTVSANKTYTFENERKSVVPTLELSANMTIEFEGNSYSLSAGSQKVREIKFKEGTNSIKIITGSGTLKATYQEATL